VGVRQRIIPLSDREEWDEALSVVPHAFGHTWASCEAMSLSGGFPTFLYVWSSPSGRAVCAFAERSFLGRRDVYTPYGFGGFTGLGDWSAMPADWRAFARDQGYVCGYVGLNPILTEAGIFDPDELFEYNDLHVLDLTRDVESLHGALSQNRRRQVRPVAGGDVAVDGAGHREFLRARLPSFYRERGASDVYSFSDQTLSRLLEVEGGMTVGAEVDGEVRAVCLFLGTGTVFEYFAGASTAEGRHFSAPLIWRGALELKSRGVPLLNLGGGVRRGDGIAAFKERFGATVRPLCALKQVYRPEDYRELCEQVGADPWDRAGFFPAYHRPATRAIDPDVNVHNSG
jgi:hypothetical protein